MNSDGWKSRKLWLTVLAMGLITWGFLMTGHEAETYGTFCMAILTSAGLFKAANVIEKRQAGK